MPTRLESALELIEKGYYVIPLSANTKTPSIGGGSSSMFRDPEAAKKWWNKSNRNIAVGCKNILVVDVDVKDGDNGLEDIRRIEEEVGELPKKAVVSTPSGGFHYYFKYPDVDIVGQVKITWKGQKTGIDLRVGNQYVVVPPSSVPNGSYSWINGPFAIDELPEVPEKWLEIFPKRNAKIVVPRVEVALKPYELSRIAKRCRSYVEKFDPAVQGSAGQTQIFRVINAIFNGFGLTKTEGWPILMEYNARCQPPWNMDNFADYRWLDGAVDRAINTPLEFGKLRDARKPSPSVYDNVYYKDFEEFEPEEDPISEPDAINQLVTYPVEDEQRFKIESTRQVMESEQAEINRVQEKYQILYSSAKDASDDVTGTVPYSLLTVPGFIDRCLEVMKGMAPKFNHHCCFASSLMLLSTLMGPKFTCHGIYGNLYTIILGGSGCGKDTGRQFNNFIMSEAFKGKPSKQALRSFTSGEAIEDDIIVNRTRLYMLDECDMLFNTLSEGKESYQRSMHANLLEIYTSVGGMFHRRINANNTKQKENSNVVQFCYNPYLNLYGTAPPENYYSSLSQRVATGGLLGRLLIFKARRGIYEKSNYGIIDESEVKDIIEFARFMDNLSFDESQGNGVNVEGSQSPVIPCQIKINDEATEILDNFAMNMNRLADCEDREAFCSIYSRSVEKIYKLVMIYEISRKWERLMSLRDENGKVSPDDVYNALEVDEVAAQWAVRITQHLILGLVEDLEKNFYVNQQDKDVKEVYKVVLSLCKRSKLDVPIAKRTSIYKRLSSMTSEKVDKLLCDLFNQEKIMRIGVPDKKGNVHQGFTSDIQKAREYLKEHKQYADYQLGQ